MLLVHKHDLQIVIVEFVETQLLPKASGWYKVGLGAASFLVTNRFNQMMDNPTTMQMMQSFGILNEEDKIDMDYAKAMALHSLKQNGGKTPPIAGCVVFDESDIESFYRTAQRIYGGVQNATQ